MEPKCADGCLYGWNSVECATCMSNPGRHRCDTCKHETEPWTNGCADCFDYELWEAKDDSNK